MGDWMVSVSSAVFNCGGIGSGFLPNGDHLSKLSGSCIEQAHGGAVTAVGAGVDVAGAGTNAEGAVAFGEPGVDEGAEVFVLALGPLPEAMEIVVDAAGHFECAPDPVGGHALL